MAFENNSQNNRLDVFVTNRRSLAHTYSEVLVESKDTGHQELKEASPIKAVPANTWQAAKPSASYVMTGTCYPRPIDTKPPCSLSSFSGKSPRLTKSVLVGLAYMHSRRQRLNPPLPTSRVRSTRICARDQPADAWIDGCDGYIEIPSPSLERKPEEAETSRSTTST